MSDAKKSGANNFAVVNHSVPRRDGVAKVTGSATYASDITLERMAWAKLLRSPFAHAKITSIDASEAKRHPGVIDVLTGDDLGALHPYYGHAVKDHPLLAIGKVRFVGEPVAAVIGEDELSAQEALHYTACGGERGPVISPVFKAGDSVLRGSNGGFDALTLPPSPFFMQS